MISLIIQVKVRTFFLNKINISESEERKLTIFKNIVNDSVHTFLTILKLHL